MNVLETLVQKLLAPFVNQPKVRAVLIPVCAIAYGVNRAFAGSDPHTWQGRLAIGSDVIVGFCAVAGIASTGVEPAAPPLEPPQKLRSSSSSGSSSLDTPPMG